MVERASHAASVGPRQERGVCEDVEDDGGGAENLHAVAVGRHESQEAFQVGHGVKGGRGLCAGQRAGGGKDAAVNAASVVEQVGNGYLELFLLGSGGGRGRVGGRALRCRRAVDGGMIDGGGCGLLDPIGAKAV